MTTRRNFLVKFTMAAGAVSVLRPVNVFAGVGAQSPVLPGTHVLTILHTANLKGQWSAVESGETMTGFGGLQRIAQQIAAIRKEVTSLLVIDAGNLTNYRQTREERLHFYQQVTHAGYDIVVPGSTDLAGGANTLAELVKESNLRILSPVDAFSINSAALPSSVVKKGKTRIGIINAGLHALKGIQRTSTVQASMAINQTAKQLRLAKRCTLIICVVQDSDQDCSRLAALSSGVDVMISVADKMSLHNTQIVQNQSNHEVIISLAGAKGAMMSRVDLTFNEQSEKINVASKAIFIGANDESYAGIVKRYAANQA